MLFSPRTLLLVLLITLGSCHPSPARPLSLPPPVVPHCFGVNIHFTGAPAQDLDGLERGGFGWVRMDFSWGAIESKKGVYDFSAYDALVNGLESRHMHPLFILDYGNDLYQKGSPRSPEARAAFVRFAVAAVKHYHGKIILWEIWNEPNGSSFWHPVPNAAQYAQMAVDTANAIKQADPDATVLAPGAAGIPLDFIETCFQKGLLRSIDAVSVHPYRGSAPETAAQDYTDLRRLIAQYAPPGKKIALISSEWGYSTVGVSEKTQAQYLARQWLFNLSEGIGLSIWYDWHEDGQDPNNNEHHFGTVRYDYTPKPAFTAAETLSHVLEGYRYIKRIPLASDDDYLLLFSRDETHIMLAAWTTGQDHALSLPIAGPTKTISMLGAATTATSAPAARAISLPLTGSPQYVQVSAAENPALLRAAAWTVTARDPVYSASLPVQLAFTYTNRDKVRHSARFLVDLSATGAPMAPLLDGEDYVKPGATLHQGVASAKFTRVPVRARIALVLDGVRQPYPQDIWFTPADPLTLTVAPAGPDGYRVEIINPAGTAFTGQFTVRSSGKPSHSTVHLAAKQSSLDLAIPGDIRALTSFTLTDAHGTPVATIPARRFVPYPLQAGELRTTLEGDPKVASVVKAQPASGSPKNQDVLKVRYSFAPGWTYWRTGEAQPKPLAGKPDAFGLWVYGDGSGNAIRMRFTDATGQTFQPDAGRLDWTGWRYITFPLTLDTNRNIGHWGGAKDGVIHAPIRIESLFLLDSQGGAKKSAGTLSLGRPSVMYSTPP